MENLLVEACHYPSTAHQNGWKVIKVIWPQAVVHLNHLCLPFDFSWLEKSVHNCMLIAKNGFSYSKNVRLCLSMICISTFMLQVCGWSAQLQMISKLASPNFFKRIFAIPSKNCNKQWQVFLSEWERVPLSNNSLERWYPLCKMNHSKFIIETFFPCKQMIMQCIDVTVAYDGLWGG